MKPISNGQSARLAYAFVLLVSFLGSQYLLAQDPPSEAVIDVSVVPAQNVISPDPHHDGSQYMYPLLTYDTPERGLVIHPDGNAARDEALTVATKRRLENTLLPDIALHNLPFSRAIERLREEGRKLDGNSGQAYWGVFIPKMPSRTSARAVPPNVPPFDLPPIGIDASTPDSEPMINLRLTGKMPLLEALRYVAQGAGMKVKIGPGTVLFLPEDAETSPLITMEFQVSPEWLDLALYEARPWIPESLRAGGHDVALVGPAEVFLEERGVAFPAGAAATYLSQTGKLVVRNTQENLDKIRALVDQSPSQITPTPAPANP